MPNDLAARCGIYCGDCDYREKMNCPGCSAATGKMFWGKCEVALCCMDKGLDHCGLCPDFPCDTLRGFADDAEQGDDGQRIRNARAWTTIGFTAWLEQKNEAEGQ
jgi:hypothetical protein